MTTLMDCNKEAERKLEKSREKSQTMEEHLECSDSGVASLASSDSSSWGSDITEPTSPHSLVSLDSPLESASHEDHTPIPSPSQEEQKHSWSYLNLSADSVLTSASLPGLLNSDICWRRNSVTCDGEEGKMVTSIRKRHSSNPSCAKDLAESSLLSDCNVKRSNMSEECNCHFIKREHVEWPIYPALTLKHLNGYSAPWSEKGCQCRLSVKSRRFKQLRITDYFKFQSKSSHKWIGLYRQTQGTKEDGRRSPRPRNDISTTTDDLSWLLQNSSGTNISLSSKCLQGAEVFRIPSPPPSRDLTLPDLINSLSSVIVAESDVSLPTELDLVNIEVEIRDTFVVQREQIKPVSRTIDGPPVQKKTGIICQWEGCETAVTTKEALLDHIKLKHVHAQSSGSTVCGNFTCQWAGCRVQGRSSKCQNWLERHVLFHVDSKPSSLKPFSCIVDGCGQRFGSQLMLQRHVNSHFSSQPSSSGSSVTRKNGELTPTKAVRKNSKKLKCRKRKATGSQIDFFDTGMTQKLHLKMVEEAERCKIVTIEDRSFEVIGDCLRLTSEEICRRKVRKGADQILISWHPADIFPQEWVSCQSVPKEKLLHLSRAPAILRQQVLSAVKHPDSSVKCPRKRARLADAPLT